MRRRRRGRALLLAVVLTLVLVSAHAAGFRLNLNTHPVAAPGPAATPEQVVTTYVEAYNRRDFSTMHAIYPGAQLPRFGVLGTMNDLVVAPGQTLTGPGDGNPAEPGRGYDRVRVTTRFSGLEGSDLAYDNGPNGWAYLLERDSPDVSWHIVYHGNP